MYPPAIPRGIIVILWTSWASSNLIPITACPASWIETSENVFLGRDYAKSRDFSDQVALEIDEQVRKIIESCYTKAKKIIGDNKDLIFALSDALIKYETITKEQIESIVETGEIKSVEEIEQEEKNEEVKETKKKIRKTKEEEK